MKKILLLLALLLPRAAVAQVIPPNQTISVVDSGTQCSVAGSCAQWSLPNTAPSFTVQVTGTLTTVTLTFRGSADGITFFDILATKLSTGVQATTTTTTGQYAIVNPGIVTLRVVGTIVTTGAANLKLTRGAASSSSRAFPSFGSFAIGDLLYASAANVISGLSAVASGQVLASAGTSTPPAYTATPTVTSLTASQTALVTTSTDGLVAVNTTPATGAATVQISPRTRWRGTAWDTSASQTVDFFAENLPATAGTPTGTWKLGYSLNGAAATYPFTVSSGGNVTALGSFTGGNNVSSPNYRVNSSTVISGTGPTIASGGCTSPAVTNANGTAKFTITIGTSCTGIKTVTLTMPAAANDWQCDAVNNTSPASFVVVATGTSTTAVVLTNYSRTTGLTIDYVAGEVLKVKCLGG